MRALRSLVVVLVALIALGAAACGRLSPVITFSVKVADEEVQPIQELLTQFRRRTGVRVELLNEIESGELPRRLEEEAAGRATIHLVAQDNARLSDLLEKRLVQDVSDVTIPEEVADSLIPQRSGGRAFFLPFRPNVRLTYANRERLDDAGARPPRTIEELRFTARQLKERAGTPKVTLSLDEGSSAAVTISEWILSFGGDPLLLNDEGSRRAFEFLQAMWKEGLLARESLQARYDTEVDNLRGETAWLAQNWPFTSAVLARDGRLNEFEVYSGWRGISGSAHVIGGDVLAIPTGVEGRRRRAAMELARFLMSKEAQELLVQESGWPSIREDAYSEVRRVCGGGIGSRCGIWPPGTRPSQLAGHFDAIRKAIDDGWYRPTVSYWDDVTEQMNEAVRRIIVRGEPIKPVLDELHDRIEAAARRRGAGYPPGQ